MKQRRPLLLVLALLLLIGAGWSYVWISTPTQGTLDQRVYEVASQLKCPVCQNESAADSSASIAQQMRQVVRQQLQEGKSEQQVLRYFADRYGNGILLTPPQQGFNLLAWLMPVIMLLLGMGLVGFVVHDWRAQARPQLTKTGEQTDEAPLDDPELEAYREQLERELADDTLLFG